MPAVDDRGRPIRIPKVKPRKPRTPTAAQVKYGTTKALQTAGRAPAPKPKPRAPRAPTALEVAYGKAKARQTADRPAPKPRHATERTAPGPSSAAVERYMGSDEYSRALTAAHLVKEIHTRKRRIEKQSGPKRSQGTGVNPYQQMGPPSTERIRFTGADRFATKGKSLEQLAEIADKLTKVEKAKPEHRAAIVKAKTPLLEREVKIGKGKFKVKESVGAGPISLAGAVFGGKKVGKFSENAIKDAAEIAITTPSSLYKLGKDIVTDPASVPGQLVEPYVELAKHPGKMISERPVSTALMVQPFVKVPLRAAGRGLAAAGKSSLKTTPATLEGTSLQAQRWRSPDLLERAKGKVDVRKGVREKPKHITDEEIARRVDEAYDAAQLHKQGAVSSAAKEANKRFGKLPKTERDAALEAHLSGARGGAGHTARRRFAKEFGSTWQVTKTGALIRPKRPAENSGVLHASKADAEKVAGRVPFEAKVFEVKSQDGKTTSYAVVPKVAADRWGHHGRVGASDATGAVVMRAGTRQFRKTVLPLSTKWLGGQVVEAALRNAVMGAGPTSYLRAKRILARMPEAERRELLNRTALGGQFGVTGPAKEFARGQASTLAEEFASTGLAKPAAKLTAAGAKPGVRQLRHGYRRYSEFVFNDINGRIEQLAKTAQLGKAVKQSPLMERRVLGLSNKAVEEAAAGLRGTSTMAELGRALDRSYGKYSKFGPHAREAILHTTPFFPWFRNMAQFVFHVMPKDHPVVTALAADIGLAEEEWRKANRLSLHGKDHVPGFLLGSAPRGKDKFTPLARFGPFLPADPVEAAGGQLLPMFQGMLMNAAGVDWTGKELKGWAGTPPGRAANAALSGLEAMVPGVSQAGRITGLSEHYVRGKPKKPSVAQGKDISQAIVDLLNPVKPIGINSGKKKKRKPASESLPGFGGGGGESLPGF